MTPSRSSSRTGSRRSSIRRGGAILAAALLALAVIGAAPAAAQGVDLDVATESDTVTASLRFTGPRPSEVADSLRSGLESRITFTVRLCEKRAGLLALFGDKVLMERSVERVAFWDSLNERFVVERADGSQSTYADSDAFLRGFFILDGVILGALPAAPRRPLYVSARAQFEPVRLMPPLTLVNLAGAATATTTPWVRKEVQ